MASIGNAYDTVKCMHREKKDEDFDSFVDEASAKKQCKMSEEALQGRKFYVQMDSRTMTYILNKYFDSSYD